MSSNYEYTGEVIGVTRTKYRGEYSSSSLSNKYEHLSDQFQLRGVTVARPIRKRTVKQGVNSLTGLQEIIR